MIFNLNQYVLNNHKATLNDRKSNYFILIRSLSNYNINIWID